MRYFLAFLLALAAFGANAQPGPEPNCANVSCTYTVPQAFNGGVLDNTVATGSFVMGTGAGAAVTGGTAQLTAIGDGAGAAFTGSGLTAFGYQACHASVSSASLGPSTCLGANAGAADLGATGNLYVGYYAGAANTSATESTFVGSHAGILSTGTSQTIGGFNAWITGTTGGSNTVWAQDGGKFFASTSHDNTLVGQSVGKSFTGASAMNYVTALGSSAFLNIYGSGDINSVAIGVGAMRGAAGNAATGGTQTVAIGTNAGLNYTTLSQDVIVGFGAGVALTSGSQSVFLGTNTGSNITTGGDLILIGTYRSNTGVQGVTSGTSDAICIGNNMKCGSGDTAVGINALSSSTENNNANVAFGHDSLHGVTTGNANAGFGGSAGYTLQTGSNNLVMGDSVGSVTLQSGSNNILIGTSNATDVLASGTSNEINIAGLIFYNSNSLAAPAVTACGTSPSIDAHANNRSGTVTVGTGSAASCTVTFAGTGYSTWNHCRVTPQTALATFGYSYTKTVLTVTATSLLNEVFDYDCDGV